MKAILGDKTEEDKYVSAMIAGFFAVREPLNYQKIGRKLLMVDDLPQGALARYEKPSNIVVI